LLLSFLSAAAVLSCSCFCAPRLLRSRSVSRVPSVALSPVRLSRSALALSAALSFARSEIHAARAVAAKRWGGARVLCKWWRRVMVHTRLKKHEVSLPVLRRFVSFWRRKHRVLMRGRAVDCLLDFLRSTRTANKHSVSRSMRRARKAVRTIQRYGRDFVEVSRDDVTTRS
jgi:hypothetical protein